MRMLFKHTHESTPPDMAEAMCEHSVCKRVGGYAGIIQGGVRTCFSHSMCMRRLLHDVRLSVRGGKACERATISLFVNGFELNSSTTLDRRTEHVLATVALDIALATVALDIALATVALDITLAAVALDIALATVALNIALATHKHHLSTGRAAVVHLNAEPGVGHTQLRSA